MTSHNLHATSPISRIDGSCSKLPGSGHLGLRNSLPAPSNELIDGLLRRTRSSSRRSSRPPYSVSRIHRYNEDRRLAVAGPPSTKS
ncbi:hypothetical protein FOZ63_031572 [Perkinsus olseni]|uniref:Uncharacterized protein n=1 Tax=Perkinsus olseni TaxID=32597 RepID=A0A7J6S4T5_PEROL|nr:hypothetical protein FOZ63_031572 [Perkinsus olseni]